MVAIRMREDAESRFVTELRAWMSRDSGMTRKTVAEISRASEADVANWEAGLDLPLRWQFSRLSAAHFQFRQIKNLLPDDDTIKERRKARLREKAAQREKERAANAVEIGASVPQVVETPQTATQQPLPFDHTKKPKTFGEALYQRRIREGLSKHDLAKTLSYGDFSTTNTSVGRWERDGGIPREAVDRLYLLWPELRETPPLFIGHRHQTVPKPEPMEAPILINERAPKPEPRAEPMPAKPMPKGSPITQNSNATEFLAKFLRDRGGRAKANAIKEVAAQKNITIPALNEAKLKLGVTRERTGFGGEGFWEWVLPAKGAAADALADAPIMLPYPPEQVQLRRAVTTNAVDQFRAKYLGTGPNRINYTKVGIQFLIDTLAETAVRQGRFETIHEDGAVIQLAAIPGIRKEMFWVAITDAREPSDHAEVILSVFPADPAILRNNSPAINTPFKQLSPALFELRKSLRDAADKQAQTVSSMHTVNTKTVITSPASRPTTVTVEAPVPPIRPVNPPQAASAMAIQTRGEPTISDDPEQLGALYGREVKKGREMQAELAKAMEVVKGLEKAIETQQGYINQIRKKLFES